MIRIKHLIFCIITCTLACNKNALEKKPSSAVLVPTSPGELQGLLDNDDVFGYATVLGSLSADEFFFTPSFYANNLFESERRAYLWDKYIFDEKETVTDWNNPYTQIYYANIVLEGLDRLPGNQATQNWKQSLRGDALFKRCLSFYFLTQLFAPAYDAQTAANDLGIPLRLTTDPQEKIIRNRVKECYQKMLDDLQEAIQLLPPLPDPLHRNRSCRAAAWALLARINLCMSDYQQAGQSAGNCLALYDSLINFNQLDTTQRIPFTANNREVLYPCKMPKLNNLFEGLFGSGTNIDSTLYRSYTSGDLRRSILFRIRTSGSVTLKGSLAGDQIPFMGISTAEVYLTMAEAQARLGHTAIALQHLNKLLSYRWKTGQFIPVTAASAEEALLFIIAERKKELVLRGLRWGDLKRLNKQGRSDTLHRIINNNPYRLDPNNPRYVLPIPEDVIRKNGLLQNSR